MEGSLDDTNGEATSSSQDGTYGENTKLSKQQKRNKEKNEKAKNGNESKGIFRNLFSSLFSSKKTPSKTSLDKKEKLKSSKKAFLFKKGNVTLTESLNNPSSNEQNKENASPDLAMALNLPPKLTNELKTVTVEFEAMPTAYCSEEREVVDRILKLVSTNEDKTRIVFCGNVQIPLNIDVTKLASMPLILLDPKQNVIMRPTDDANHIPIHDMEEILKRHQMRVNIILETHKFANRHDVFRSLQEESLYPKTLDYSFVSSSDLERYESKQPADNNQSSSSGNKKKPPKTTFGKATLRALTTKDEKIKALMNEEKCAYIIGMIWPYDYNQPKYQRQTERMLAPSNSPIIYPSRPLALKIKYDNREEIVYHPQRSVVQKATPSKTRTQKIVQPNSFNGKLKPATEGSSTGHEKNSKSKVVKRKHYIPRGRDKTLELLEEAKYKLLEYIQTEDLERKDRYKDDEVAINTDRLFSVQGKSNTRYHNSNSSGSSNGNRTASSSNSRRNSGTSTHSSSDGQKKNFNIFSSHGTASQKFPVMGLTGNTDGYNNPRASEVLNTEAQITARNADDDPDLIDFTEPRRPSNQNQEAAFESVPPEEETTVENVEFDTIQNLYGRENTDANVDTEGAEKGNAKNAKSLQIINSADSGGTFFENYSSSSSIEQLESDISCNNNQELYNKPDVPVADVPRSEGNDKKGVFSIESSEVNETVAKQRSTETLLNPTDVAPHETGSNALEIETENTARSAIWHERNRGSFSGLSETAEISGQDPNTAGQRPRTRDNARMMEVYQVTLNVASGEPENENIIIVIEDSFRNGTDNSIPTEESTKIYSNYLKTEQSHTGIPLDGVSNADHSMPTTTDEIDGSDNTIVANEFPSKCNSSNNETGIETNNETNKNYIQLEDSGKHIPIIDTKLQLTDAEYSEVINYLFPKCSEKSEQTHAIQCEKCSKTHKLEPESTKSPNSRRSSSDISQVLDYLYPDPLRNPIQTERLNKIKERFNINTNPETLLCLYPDSPSSIMATIDDTVSHDIMYGVIEKDIKEIINELLKETDEIKQNILATGVEMEDGLLFTTRDNIIGEGGHLSPPELTSLNDKDAKSVRKELDTTSIGAHDSSIRKSFKCPLDFNPLLRNALESINRKICQAQEHFVIPPPLCLVQNDLPFYENSRTKFGGIKFRARREELFTSAKLRYNPLLNFTPVSSIDSPLFHLMPTPFTDDSELHFNYAYYNIYSHDSQEINRYVRAHNNNAGGVKKQTSDAQNSSAAAETLPAVMKSSSKQSNKATIYSINMKEQGSRSTTYLSNLSKTHLTIDPIEKSLLKRNEDNGSDEEDINNNNVMMAKVSKHILLLQDEEPLTLSQSQPLHVIGNSSNPRLFLTKSSIIENNSGEPSQKSSTLLKSSTEACAPRVYQIPSLPLPKVDSDLLMESSSDIAQEACSIACIPIADQTSGVSKIALVDFKMSYCNDENYLDPNACSTSKGDQSVTANGGLFRLKSFSAMSMKSSSSSTMSPSQGNWYMGSNRLEKPSVMSKSAKSMSIVSRNFQQTNVSGSSEEMIFGLDEDEEKYRLHSTQSCHILTRSISMYSVRRRFEGSDCSFCTENFEDSIPAYRPTRVNSFDSANLELDLKEDLHNSITDFKEDDILPWEDEKHLEVMHSREADVFPEMKFDGGSQRSLNAFTPMAMDFQEKNCAERPYTSGIGISLMEENLEPERNITPSQPMENNSSLDVVSKSYSETCNGSVEKINLESRRSITDLSIGTTYFDGGEIKPSCSEVGESSSGINKLGLQSSSNVLSVIVEGSDETKCSIDADESFLLETKIVSQESIPYLNPLANEPEESIVTRTSSFNIGECSERKSDLMPQRSITDLTQLAKDGEERIKAVRFNEETVCSDIQENESQESVIGVNDFDEIVQRVSSNELGENSTVGPSDELKKPVPNSSQILRRTEEIIELKSSKENDGERCESQIEENDPCKSLSESALSDKTNEIAQESIDTVQINESVETENVDSKRCTTDLRQIMSDAVTKSNESQSVNCGQVSDNIQNETNTINDVRNSGSYVSLNNTPAPREVLAVGEPSKSQQQLNSPSEIRKIEDNVTANDILLKNEDSYVSIDSALKENSLG